MSDKKTIEQITREIQFLEFDIQMDECLEGSIDFHMVKDRLEGNREKLKELKALINE